jgi:Fe-S-cluster containining protein
MAAYCLSVHASYRCRHAGACCEADWHISVEPEVIALVNGRGIARPGHTGDRFARREGGGFSVARDLDGTCVFFDRAGGRLCRIHQHAGPEALPSACRHFPRVVLHDDRGDFMTLSHYCPTAAVMLLDPAPLRVVQAAPPLLIEDLDGYQARGALPPLVRPGLLSDLAGYDGWERACLAELGRRDRAPEASLGVIAQATELIRAWRPAEGPMAPRVAEAFATARAAPAEPVDLERDACLVERLSVQRGARFSAGSASLPEIQSAWMEHVAPALSRFDAATANYLAARIFANRVAYEARGLRTLVAWIRTCLALLRRELANRAMSAGAPTTLADFVEAARAADLILMHVADTRAFAVACEPMEREPAR